MFLQAICLVYINTFTQNKINIVPIIKKYLPNNDFFVDIDRFIREKNFDYTVFRITDENSAKRLIDKIWVNEHIDGIYEYIFLLKTTTINNVLEYFASLPKIKNIEKFKQTIFNDLESLKNNGYVT